MKNAEIEDEVRRPAVYRSISNVPRECTGAVIAISP